MAKPKAVIPPSQVAEARASLAALQARASRRQSASDEDEDGAGTHNLLLGPRNVRPYRERKGALYMGREQLDHFRVILNSWKRDLMEEVDRTMSHMKDELAANPPDPNDRATLESEFALELRTRDRERKLIRKIEEALSRIEDGSYGYAYRLFAIFQHAGGSLIGYYSEIHDGYRLHRQDVVFDTPLQHRRSNGRVEKRCRSGRFGKLRFHDSVQQPQVCQSKTIA